MRLRKEYTDLTEVLLYLKEQVIESIHFAIDFLPANVQTAEQIFDFLKRNTIYFNDPKNVELLQSMPTMFSSENRHHVYGAGDCDCFTISCLASLIATGHNNNFIVLAGRSRENPVHIYCGTVQAGKKYYMDLTNDYFDQIRKYPYTQELPISV